MQYKYKLNTAMREIRFKKKNCFYFLLLQTISVNIITLFYYYKKIEWSLSHIVILLNILFHYDIYIYIILKDHVKLKTEVMPTENLALLY